MSKALAVAVLLLAAGLALGQSADEKKATVAYVQALQTKQGGFKGSADTTAPTLRATSSSLRALRYFGGKAKDEEACRKFVLACHDTKTGGFSDRPRGRPDVIVTAVGLMALVELKVPTAKYEKAAIDYMTESARTFEEMRMAAAGLEAVSKTSDKNREWLKKLGRMRNTDWTFGKGDAKVRETGGAVAAVLRLGGKVEAKGVLKALDAGQRKDGGFGKEKVEESDLETSYRVMRTYHMLKAKPARADDLKALVAKCRNKDGGYGVVPGGPSSTSGTYFAGIILHWLGEK
jgi:prenyltransferase beta subunit